MEVLLPVGAHIFPDESICPGDLSNIRSFPAVEVLHAPQSVWVNDDAEPNIKAMLVTLDTSQLEMSQLNDDAW